MRALRHYLLVPLVIAAVLLGAAMTPCLSTRAAHHSAALVLRSCPEGTNWDNSLGACV